MDILDYVLSFERNDYQRYSFDDFLKAVKFDYRVPTIHIAGTNGKGSTANYLSSIYQKAGYKVGLFTSPFFYSFTEMIKINGAEITKEEVSEIINPVKKQIEKKDLSSFEIQTYIALIHFINQKVDIAIVECGMGGETDATNVFIPILSIITSVSLEHTMFLGKTISEIATQKAGIIKKEIPVLIGTIDEEGTNAISKVCLLNKSKLNVVSKYAFESLEKDGFYFDYGTYKKLHIPSHGEYSILDACIAIDATKILSNSFPVQETNIRDGLESFKIEFRFDIVKENPTIILDGAHNPEAMENLCKTVEKYANNTPIHVVFACFRDKNIQKMLESLSILSSDVTLTTFDHPRARTEDEYFLFGGDYAFVPDYKSLIQSKIDAFPDDIILITGSLSFVSFVKKMF